MCRLHTRRVVLLDDGEGSIGRVGIVLVVHQARLSFSLGLDVPHEAQQKIGHGILVGGWITPVKGLLEARANRPEDYRAVA